MPHAEISTTWACGIEVNACGQRHIVYRKSKRKEQQRKRIPVMHRAFMSPRYMTRGAQGCKKASTLLYQSKGLSNRGEASDLISQKEPESKNAEIRIHCALFLILFTVSIQVCKRTMRIPARSGCLSYRQAKLSSCLLCCLVRKMTGNSKLMTDLYAFDEKIEPGSRFQISGLFLLCLSWSPRASGQLLDWETLRFKMDGCR